MTTLIHNAQVVNEDRQFAGGIVISGSFIEQVFEGTIPEGATADRIIDAGGKLLIPGMIDDQVHFREPGLTHKADIHSESRAAVAGGITSYMEMPNTKPGAVTLERLDEKYAIAETQSLANYSFYMGTTNDNLDEVKRVDYTNVCGVKIFMGSSTGNMLVDDLDALEKLFCKTRVLIATHCEDDPTIAKNLEAFKERFGSNIPMNFHPLIRSREACYASSSLAVSLANKCEAKLHILHISTAEELALFRNDIPLAEKRVTSEACIHHLWFTDEDYDEKGSHIKWNPAVKTLSDREALWEAVLDDRIDVIATDHAPHTREEKDQEYTQAPSGGPLVQHALPALFECHLDGRVPLEKIVRKTSHNVADLFHIHKRGYIREGYYADVVLVDLNDPWTVSQDNLLYKCGWSPFEGQTFRARIATTFVNGEVVYDQGKLIEGKSGMRMTFDR